MEKKERNKRERESKEKTERGGGRCEGVGGRERQMTEKQRDSKRSRQMHRRRWGRRVGKKKNMTRRDIEADK